MGKGQDNTTCCSACEVSFGDALDAWPFGLQGLVLRLGGGSVKLLLIAMPPLRGSWGWGRTEGDQDTVPKTLNMSAV